VASYGSTRQLDLGHLALADGDLGARCLGTGRA